uniref:Uncharacterized protein n=1 Tax=Anthurium amnicola TaxID=1678845 RepID=A0A1D1Y0W9_9ARAE
MRHPKYAAKDSLGHLCFSFHREPTESSDSLWRGATMGGKGRRRREKNYNVAHGGDTRLPPPPDPGTVDAVPSKLRRLMRFMNRPPPEPGPSEGSKDRGNGRDKGITPDKRSEETKSVEDKKGAVEVTNTNTNDKKKRKRKRKAAMDLRFQDLDQAGGLSRKQKRKEYFESRKKKQKKAKQSEISEFPEHERIRFGEIVEAPPRLSFPKVLKTVHDASHERRRLQLIDSYRNKKRWESRPGIHLPSITENLSP